MSEALIKGTASDALDRVRALPGPAPRLMPSPQLPDPQWLAAQRRVAELEAEVAEHVQDKEKLRLEVERALERGRTEGHAEGAKAADRREKERLDLLARSLSEARSDLANALKGAERLAALVARDCLDKLLGDSAYRSGILHQLIRTQMAQINAESVVSIAVSAQDFSDDAALAGLREATAPHRAEILADPTLAPGGAVIAFRLGKADIGLGQQWSALSSLLTQMSEEGTDA